MLNPEVLKCHEDLITLDTLCKTRKTMDNKATRSPEISREQVQKLNTTIFVIYILDIDSHCPYLLSGETTFQLTSC